MVPSTPQSLANRGLDPPNCTADKHSKPSLGFLQISWGLIFSWACVFHCHITNCHKLTTYLKQHKRMTSPLPRVRSPAHCSWVCSSPSHEAEIQMWGLKQGPLPSHSPATTWPCLTEEETTTVRPWPETVLDTVPIPDLPVFTPRSPPGLEADSKHRLPHKGTSVPTPGRAAVVLVGEGVGQGWEQPGRQGSQAPVPRSIIPSDLTYGSTSRFFWPPLT